MDQEFHLYCYSQHSKEFFPSNGPSDFTIHLPKSIHLEGAWECGLMQFKYTTTASTTEKPFYVCCDLVSESYSGDFTLPILRRVRLRTTQFSHVIYVPLKTRDFNVVRLYLRTWKNKDSPVQRGDTHCTLHFRRIL